MLSTTKKHAAGSRGFLCLFGETALVLTGRDGRLEDETRLGGPECTR